MKTLKDLGITRNFEQLLPELKQKTLQWKTTCYSNTEMNTSSKISSYHNLNGKSHGTLVLIPALASNSEIDPLGKTISYWGLTHQYNIITIDTFLGDFQPCPSEEELKKRTFPEFIEILTQSIGFIEPYIIDNYSCIIGHCASANGIMTVFNNNIKHNKPINYNSSILFAPWPTMQPNYEPILKRMLANSHPNDILTPLARLKIDHFTYITKMKNFEDQLNDNTKQFNFETMAQWEIKTILVSADRDKIVPSQRVHDNYKKLTSINPNANIKHISFSNTDHSFSGIKNNIVPVIELIKSLGQKQRQK